jgi:hypothetical protein
MQHLNSRFNQEIKDIKDELAYVNEVVIQSSCILKYQSYHCDSDKNHYEKRLKEFMTQKQILEGRLLDAIAWEV